MLFFVYKSCMMNYIYEIFRDFVVYDLGVNQLDFSLTSPLPIWWPSGSTHLQSTLGSGSSDGRGLDYWSEGGELKSLHCSFRKALKT